ncbi:hypothetical protein K402DRAFT_265824 [Aulographum hederae CBS 113979]|uniref:Uncharacterized protein n=1 Tax=Aulographum hederae CBS 113979 TaxID=1176131 RepID=A0A6G1GIX0_9PEZI|nr:hypothetical protein K402DRAFT_265824 [Aulographum hederae CBS 113979]
MCLYCKQTWTAPGQLAWVLHGKTGGMGQYCRWSRRRREFSTTRAELSPSLILVYIPPPSPPTSISPSPDAGPLLCAMTEARQGQATRGKAKRATGAAEATAVKALAAMAVFLFQRGRPAKELVLVVSESSSVVGGSRECLSCDGCGAKADRMPPLRG